MKTPGIPSPSAFTPYEYAKWVARQAEYNALVRAKVDALDAHVPYCRACGETVTTAEAGTRCKQNNIPMSSKWARDSAARDFYDLGNSAYGGWANSVEALACLLDRVWAEALRAKS